MGTITNSLVFTAVFLGLFVVPARAQDIVTAKVPFAFVVRGEVFPAGKYEIRTANADVISIRNRDSRLAPAAFALTMPADGHDPIGEQPVLVFTRHESQYRLSEIWASGMEGRMLMGGSKNAHAEAQARPSAASTYLVSADLK